MKMYIGVLETVPDHMVPVLVAHAVLRHHLAVEDWTLPYDARELYSEWICNSFKKCVVKIPLGAWPKALALDGAVHSHENTVLDGTTSCVTLVATDEDRPNVFKYAPLWKPTQI